MPAIDPRHDDRLATVLAAPSDSPAMARVQWRQLVDLLGIAPAGAFGAQYDAAYLRLAQLARAIPAKERAAMLGAAGLRLRAPRLVAELARGEATVAAAALGAATLDEAQWLDLLPALSPPALMLLAMRPDLPPAVRGRLAPLASGSGLPAPTPAAPTPSRDSIGAIGARIEAYQRARGSAPSGAGEADAPPLPRALERDAPIPPPPGTVDFATDAIGRIVAGDSAARPLIGAWLAGLGDHTIGAALRSHQPIRDAEVQLVVTPLAGRWRLDATPRFGAGGGYLGHISRLRRVDAPSQQPTHGQADRLRQLLHELRTPINAIQGFAEIIQQQVFGPLPHEYRAFAATIAADAARILGGFDELDRLARLESGALQPEPGTVDFAAVLRDATARLAPALADQKTTLTLSGDPQAMAAINGAEAGRLAWRLLATLAVEARDAQADLRVTAQDRTITVAARWPAAPGGRDGLTPFAAPLTKDAPGLAAPSLFGPRFALRLLAAEAQALGGAVAQGHGWLTLTLPGLTGLAPTHTKQQRAAAW